jgi:hypothetical protein
MDAPAPEVTISAAKTLPTDWMDGMAITVENHSAKAVDAMYFDYLVGEKVVMHQFCINTEGLGPWIEPGKSLRLPAHPLPPQRYLPGTPVSCRIDGVVFTDGRLGGWSPCGTRCIRGKSW